LQFLACRVEGAVAKMVSEHGSKLMRPCISSQCLYTCGLDLRSMSHGT
jgi:hypothetical protein